MGSPNLKSWSEGGFALATYIGQSAWLYDGSTTLNVGLTDAEHTRSTDNTRFSLVRALNEAGQVAGSAYRYDGATFIGRSAWFFDGTTTFVLDALSVRSSDDYALSDVSFLGEDGLVLGYYTLFDEFDISQGNRAFWFMESEGIFDLGLMVDDSFTTQDWVYLASAISSNLPGLIMGHGLLGDMTSGQVAYLLTPTATVPIPATVWLFGSAMGLLGWMRRRTT